MTLQESEICTQIIQQYQEQLQLFHPELVRYLKANGAFRAHIDRCMAIMLPYVKLQLKCKNSVEPICEECLCLLMDAVGPSRQGHLDKLLRQNFPQWHHELVQSGQLHATLNELVTLCTPLFIRFDFDFPSSIFSRLDADLSVAIQQYRQAGSR